GRCGVIGGLAVEVHLHPRVAVTGTRVLGARVGAGDPGALEVLGHRHAEVEAVVHLLAEVVRYGGEFGLLRLLGRLGVLRILLALAVLAVRPAALAVGRPVGVAAAGRGGAALRCLPSPAARGRGDDGAQRDDR